MNINYLCQVMGKMAFSGILKTITFKRIVNASLVHGSFYLSRVLGKSVHWGMPISISVEPTTACNLGCPECPSGLKQFSRKTGNLKMPFFKKLIEEIKSTTGYLTFYFQGEPYINPSFLDMVRIAADANIYTSTSTNAHFLTPSIAKKTVESGLHRMIISIDGTTQEVYEQYRKQGTLEKVLEGTRNLIQAKEEANSQFPQIIFQFLVVQPNQHQIDDVLALGKKMGVNEVLLKTAQVYDFENGNPLIPTIEKYARYKQGKDGKWKIKNKLENHCLRMWSSCVITWDGKVVPCCFDKDATHQLGDVSELSFKEVWKSKSYNSFRNNVLTDRQAIDICNNCTEGTTVWA